MQFIFFFLFVFCFIAVCDEKNYVIEDQITRDPFIPEEVDPDERDAVDKLGGSSLNYSLNQFSLRAILEKNNIPQALFEDPEGQTYIKKEGEFLGREKSIVSRILHSEVIMTQITYNYLGVKIMKEHVLSLPKSIGEIRLEKMKKSEDKIIKNNKKSQHKEVAYE